MIDITIELNILIGLILIGIVFMFMKMYGDWREELVRQELRRYQLELERLKEMSK